jgi:hypothetical protein
MILVSSLDNVHLLSLRCYPLRFWGSITGDAIALFVSEDSRWISGQSINVSGSAK